MVGFSGPWKFRRDLDHLADHDTSTPDPRAHRATRPRARPRPLDGKATRGSPPPGAELPGRAPDQEHAPRRRRDVTHDAAAHARGGRRNEAAGGADRPRDLRPRTTRTRAVRTAGTRPSSSTGKGIGPDRMADAMARCKDAARLQQGSRRARDCAVSRRSIMRPYAYGPAELPRQLVPHHDEPDPNQHACGGQPPTYEAGPLSGPDGRIDIDRSRLRWASACTDPAPTARSRLNPDSRATRCGWTTRTSTILDYHDGTRVAAPGRRCRAVKRLSGP